MRRAFVLLSVIAMMVALAACGPSALPPLLSSPTAVQAPVTVPAGGATPRATAGPVATPPGPGATREPTAPATGPTAAGVMPSAPATAVAPSAGTGPGVPTPTGGARVSGNVTYEQRMALPPDAVVEVSLLDTTRADAPATVVATHSRPAGGQQPPFPFEIAYDPAGTDSGHSYVIQARILVGNRLLFVSTQAYPVITGGHPSRDVQVVVQPVPAAPTTTDLAPELVGVMWRWQKAVDRSGKDQITVPRPEHYWFELLSEGRFRFQADCNNGYGTFTLQDGTLRLQPGPMTRMACPGQSLGNQYLQLLGEVVGYAFEQGYLLLYLPGNGGTLVFAR